MINFNWEASEPLVQEKGKKREKMTFEQDLERGRTGTRPRRRKEALGYTARKNKSYGRENKTHLSVLLLSVGDLTCYFTKNKRSFLSYIAKTASVFP